MSCAVKRFARADVRDLLRVGASPRFIDGIVKISWWGRGALSHVQLTGVRI